MTRRFPEEERRAVFAGSFNPFTLGHLSVLRRGLKLFDHVTVVIGINDSKGADGAETERRLEAVRRAVEGLDGVDGDFLERSHCRCRAPAAAPAGFCAECAMWPILNMSGNWPISTATFPASNLF